MGEILLNKTTCKQPQMETEADFRLEKRGIKYEKNVTFHNIYNNQK